MNFQEKSILVRRISNGKLHGVVNFGNTEYFAVFSDPTLSLMAEADWVYQKNYDSLKAEADVITLEESYKILVEQGKWNNLMEKEMQGISKDIEVLTKSLIGMKYNKAATKATKKTIEKGKLRLQELYLIKNQLSTSTIEFMAERSKKRFIISKIAKMDDCSELLENPLFKDNLIVYYFEESSISESKLRELARSDPWRLYWTTSKDTGTPLFPHSCVEMTDLQYSLVLWSKLYDFAYSSSNRPTDDIIADDDRFDAWYRQECERIDAETAKGQLGDNFGSASEVFIPADAEGAKEVYALNNVLEREKLRQREKFIADKGEVKEQALPDVKQKIQMEMNRLGADAIKNRS